MFKIDFYFVDKITDIFFLLMPLKTVLWVIFCAVNVLTRNAFINVCMFNFYEVH